MPIPINPSNSPILIRPDASISRDDIPEISLTENIVPDARPSDIENNCPAVDSKDKVESGNIFKLIPLAAVPVPVKVKVFVPEEYFKAGSYANPDVDTQKAMVFPEPVV